MPISSETLSAEELVTITGGARKRDQVAWLDANRWVYYTNRAGEPVVGRLYARLKLAGINPSKFAGGEQWSPDLGNVR
ncbi:hypothetical protein CEK28_05000 [Xenophilus sp. AP218F]|nr:hypothetical protein CEK28_05000 [Xenophilus sp. AP218F]